ncbi:MAG: hypothetical protein HRU38_05630 [Saccharospirillaceae bacterium]|nr:hypothetical protein [Pseudomonadales bacterium]NRB78137.1 hypothetical protein [Saccharospirillaceae bacterium]
MKIIKKIFTSYGLILACLVLYYVLSYDSVLETEFSMSLRVLVIFPIATILMLYLYFFYNNNKKGSVFQRTRNMHIKQKINNRSKKNKINKMYAKKKNSDGIIVYKTFIQIFSMILLFVIMGGLFGWLSFILVRPILTIFANEPWSKAYQVERFYFPTPTSRGYSYQIIPTIILNNVHEIDNKYYHVRYKMVESRYIHNEFKRDDFICLKGKTWFLGTKIIDEIKMYSKLSTQLYCNNEVLFQLQKLIVNKIKLSNIDSIFLNFMYRAKDGEFLSLIHERHFVMEYNKVDGRVELSYAISSPDFIKFSNYMSKWAKDNQLNIKTEIRNGLKFSTVYIPKNTPNYQQKSENGDIKEYKADVYLLLQVKSMLKDLGQLTDNDVVEANYLGP